MLDSLSDFVTLLLALSIASERVVEIIKGWVPYLNEKKVDPIQEGRRASIIHILAVFAGVATAVMAADIIGNTITLPTDGFQKSVAIIGMGFLASGGSGMWNSVLQYIKGVKDIKESVAKQVSQQVEETQRRFAGPRQPALGGGGRG